MKRPWLFDSKNSKSLDNMVLTKLVAPVSFPYWSTMPLIFKVITKAVSTDDKVQLRDPGHSHQLLFGQRKDCLKLPFLVFVKEDIVRIFFLYFLRGKIPSSLALSLLS